MVNSFVRRTIDALGNNSINQLISEGLTTLSLKKSFCEADGAHAWRVEGEELEVVPAFSLPVHYSSGVEERRLHG